MPSCGTSLCFFKPVIAVVGALAVGVAGYNFLSSGCVFGGCADKAAEAAVVTTAGNADDECALSGCSSAEEATVIAVAHESATEKECAVSKTASANSAACDAKKAAACADKTERAGCAEKAAECSEEAKAACKAACEARKAEAHAADGSQG